VNHHLVKLIQSAESLSNKILSRQMHFGREKEIARAQVN